MIARIRLLTSFFFAALPLILSSPLSLASLEANSVMTDDLGIRPPALDMGVMGLDGTLPVPAACEEGVLKILKYLDDYRSLPLQSGISSVFPDEKSIAAEGSNGGNVILPRLPSLLPLGSDHRTPCLQSYFDYYVMASVLVAPPAVEGLGADVFLRSRYEASLLLGYLGSRQKLGVLNPRQTRDYIHSFYSCFESKIFLDPSLSPQEMGEEALNMLRSLLHDNFGGNPSAPLIEISPGKSSELSAMFMTPLLVEEIDLLYSYIKSGAAALTAEGPIVFNFNSFLNALSSLDKAMGSRHFGCSPARRAESGTLSFSPISPFFVNSGSEGIDESDILPAGPIAEQDPANRSTALDGDSGVKPQSGDGTKPQSGDGTKPLSGDGVKPNSRPPSSLR